MSRVVRVCACVVAAALLVPAWAWAQSGTTAAIAGEARDATGSVLPGVVVEAASPALIEKVRTAVTDDRGQYKIVDLRPGPYTVTFSLVGFSTVRREGLELNTGFTATVNAELRVGGIEETITVSGASPVVDTQNVRTQSVLTREVLDVVPTSKNYQAFAGLTLGAVGSTAGATGGGDSGGAKGEQMTGLTIHGAGAGLTTVDGMRINTATNFWDNHRYFFNQLSVQEVVMETGGAGAESMSGGLNVNMVPKDGGNVVRGSFVTEYANSDMQGSNLTDELRARGLTRTNQIRRIYDLGGGVGGPLKRDRLWFFTAHRAWGSQEELAGVYFNKLQGTLFYEPDLDRPGYYDNYVRDSNLRLTWQATPKQKVDAFGSAPGLLPLLQHARRHRRHARAGVDLRLPHVPEQSLPGQLELPGDAAPAVRSGRHAASRTSSRPEAGRNRQRAVGQRAHDRHRLRVAVQRADDVTKQLRRSRTAGSVLDQGGDVVHHRIACVQGGRRDVFRRGANRRRPRLQRAVRVSEPRSHAARAGGLSASPHRERRDGPWHLRAGSVDAGQPDAEPGRAIRLPPFLQSRSNPSRGRVPSRRTTFRPSTTSPTGRTSTRASALRTTSSETARRPSRRRSAATSSPRRPTSPTGRTRPRRLRCRPHAPGTTAFIRPAIPATGTTCPTAI